MEEGSSGLPLMGQRLWTDRCGAGTAPLGGETVGETGLMGPPGSEPAPAPSQSGPGITCDVQVSGLS